MPERERPAWCPLVDTCVPITGSGDVICGGKLKDPIDYKDGPNTHTLCIDSNNGRQRFHLDHEDCYWLSLVINVLSRSAREAKKEVAPAPQADDFWE